MLVQAYLVEAAHKLLACESALLQLELEDLQVRETLVDFLAEIYQSNRVQEVAEVEADDLNPGEVLD